MRFLKLNILVAALVLFTAAGASAWQVRDTSAQYGTSINIGDSVTVTIDLNTDGGTDLFALGVGFLFEGTGFTYDQGSSATNTYLLYTTAKNPYLIPASTCGGVSGSGCDTYLTNPNQVQLDFVSSAVGTGAGVPAASVGFENLATLVFTATTPGTYGFLFTFDPVTGGVLGLGDGSTESLTLGAGGSVTVVPEPTTALLFGLGLIGLGVAGRRS
ncbi:PEP-CTERM sorting domain-containing protein [Myxococcota bacterium]|nr:PEP-CTERM sorting domain-containing protein [Myxococcota bacterium]